MSVGETVVQNEEVIKQEALTVIEQAKIVKIIDQISYDSATTLLLDSIKPLRKKWKEFWYGGATDPGPIPLARKAYESLLDKFNAADKPLKDAEDQVKLAIGNWDEEQKRKQQELQRRDELAAKKKAEDEAAIAAAVAEDSGATPEEIEAIVSAPVITVAAPVEPTYTKATGVIVKEQWGARVVDIKKLCAAVAKGTVPVSYIEPNMVALNSRARADRQTMNVPGVVAVKNSVVSGRTK